MAGGEAACRGCGKLLRLNPGTGVWTDENGFAICVKARLEDTGHGQRPDYVLHQPMPAGLAAGLKDITED